MHSASTNFTADLCSHDPSRQTENQKSVMCQRRRSTHSEIPVGVAIEANYLILTQFSLLPSALPKVPDWVQE